MVDEGSPSREPVQDEAETVVRAVRALDPSSSEESIRRFLQEIADAEAVLAGIDLDDAWPVATFSPLWNRGSTR
jgi:hypothetical protein